MGCGLTFHQSERAQIGEHGTSTEIVVDPRRSMDGCAKDDEKIRQMTRQVKRKLEMQQSASSSLGRPRSEAVLSQTVEHVPMQAETPVGNVSEKPTKSTKQESRAVLLRMDETSSASQQKRFVIRPGQFVASQLRKVEVSVKNLSHDELRQLEQTKQNETRTR